MPDIYLLAEMDSHLFRVVTQAGEVVDKVDILAAEALEYQLKKQGLQVEWVDRIASKERKHVRQLISNFQNSHSFSHVVGSAVMSGHQA